jgi:hypothetical protein
VKYTLLTSGLAPVVVSLSAVPFLDLVGVTTFCTVRSLAGF